MEQTNTNRPSGMFGFTIVWIGQIVSVLASSMSQFALTIFMFDQTGSALAMGMMQVFFITPFLLISPLAGVGGSLQPQTDDDGQRHRRGDRHACDLNIASGGRFGVLAFVWRFDHLWVEYGVSVARLLCRNFDDGV